MSFLGDRFFGPCTAALTLTGHMPVRKLKENYAQQMITILGRLVFSDVSNTFISDV